MGRVHFEAGYAVWVYSRDHGEPHAHVLCKGGEVVVFLGDDKTKPTLRNVRGKVRTRHIVRAMEIIDEQQGRLLATWRYFHG